MSSPQPIDQDLRRRILRARLLMEQALPEAVDLSRLARESHFSPRHFQRAFRDVVGETVREHQRRLLIERAAYLLRHTDFSVEQVGRHVGFTTASGFTRAFRQCFGETPSDYQNRPESTVFLRDSDSVTDIDLLGQCPISPTIETVPAQRVAILRHTGPVESIPEAWLELRRLATRHALIDAETRYLGIYHDAWETEPEHCRYDAALTVSDTLDQLPAPLEFHDLPGGQVATVLAEGRVSQIERTWYTFSEHWLPASGLAPRLPYAWEVYPASLVHSHWLTTLMRTWGSLTIRLCLPIGTEFIPEADGSTTRRAVA